MQIIAIRYGYAFYVQYVASIHNISIYFYNIPTFYHFTFLYAFDTFQTKLIKLLTKSYIKNNGNIDLYTNIKR